MERTVPSTASEEVELYLRTYYSLLRSTAEVHIRTLEEVHAGMNSLLHGAARQTAPDMSAFIYSLLRMPACLPDVQLVVLGQTLDVFQSGGYGNIENWEQVVAVARRRRCFYDGKRTLACFIASRSDIDDVIPLLTAFQIEWNKLNNLLQSHKHFDFASSEHKAGAQQALASILQIGLDDLARLRTAWGRQFAQNMEMVANRRMALHIQLLSGSLSEYRRATNQWWENIERLAPFIKDRPVYFISSNTHSLANLVSGYALRKRPELLAYLEQSHDSPLKAEWQDIQDNRINSSEENFLYYLMKKYQSTPEGQGLIDEQRQVENQHGLQRFPSEHSFDVEAQVIELNKLKATQMDPRLCCENVDPDELGQALAKSDALVINIDYPLGLAAYNILAEVADQAGKVLGVYVMGKAASLNGVVGDVMIPNVVHDEHSKNTFLFSNCFSSADVSPYLKFGAVLDNQKAVSVRGTFLQNAQYMDVFYREGYTDIEMEAGPYLSATYEMYRPQRHPVDEIVNLYGLPFDLGLIHYVSDTPLSKGRNLGSSNLSYYGMDSTYAATVAILRRILNQEVLRMRK
jgi:hypothetical protein